MKILKILFLLLVLSCQSFKRDMYWKAGETKVIKYMFAEETIVEYGEKMFWHNPQEHAVMYQSAIDIKKRVKLFTPSNNKKFANYNYCFIVDDKNGIDTIFADFSLKAWNFKKNGRSNYYYDETGELAKDLKHLYPFFKDYW